MTKELSSHQVHRKNKKSKKKEAKKENHTLSDRKTRLRSHIFFFFFDGENGGMEITRKIKNTDENTNTQNS